MDVIDISNEDALNTPTQMEAVRTPSPKKQKMTIDDVLKEEEGDDKFETFKKNLITLLQTRPFLLSKVHVLFNDATIDDLYISQAEFDNLLMTVIESKVPFYHQNTVYYELICTTYEKVPKTDLINAAEDDLSLKLMNKIKEQPTEIAEHMFVFHRDIMDLSTVSKDSAKKYCIDMFKRLCMHDSSACMEVGRAKILMSGHVATYYNYLNL